MFSQVSVCSHGGGGGTYLPADRGGGGYLSSSWGAHTLTGVGWSLPSSQQGGTCLPDDGGTYPGKEVPPSQGRYSLAKIGTLLPG